MKNLKRVLFFLIISCSLSASANEDLLKLVPKDCNMVIGIKVGDILNIPIVKQTLEQNKESMKAQLGNPEMIDTILIAMNATDEKSIAMGELEVFSVGVMKESTTIDEMLKIAGSGQTEFKKAKFLDKEYYEGEKDGKTLGIYQISETTFIAGTKDLLHKGIMINKGMGTSLADNALIKKLLKSDGSILYAGGALPKSAEYKGFSLFSSYDKGLKLNTRIYCKAAATATTLSTQISSFLPMLTANPAMGIKPEDIKVAAKDSNVSVNAFISEATLKQIPILIQTMLMQSMSSEPGAPAVEETPK